jgi:hypothetical protein
LKTLIAAIVFLLLPALAERAKSSPALLVFVDDLFSGMLPQYEPYRSVQLGRFCDEFNLDCDDSVKRSFLRIYFLHDLLTGNGASNCVSGGFLRIPYFWHWVTPNPRHSIMLLPDSLRLSSLPPPERFAKYRTYADIDRPPSMFLADLLSVHPKYYHPDCGAFYTFGWCSEREMAFSALTKVLGYDCKIVQRGIHTWSEVWFSCVSRDSSTANILIRVDNTFDLISWKRAPLEVSQVSWRSDVGRGSTIGWYNRTAAAEQELRAIRELSIERNVADRIEHQIRSALGGRRNR